MPMHLDFQRREIPGMNRNQSMAAAFDIPINIEVPVQN